MVPKMLMVAVICAGLSSGCSSAQTQRASGQVRQPDITLANGKVLTDVFVADDEAEKSVTLFYRTAVPLSNCQELQAEVREVWLRNLRPEANRRNTLNAILFPEDRDGNSRDFTYKRKPDTEWQEWNFGRCEK